MQRRPDLNLTATTRQTELFSKSYGCFEKRDLAPPKEGYKAIFRQRSITRTYPLLRLTYIAGLKQEGDLLVEAEVKDALKLAWQRQQGV